MQYTAPWGASDPNASFVNGNPAIGLPGSIVPAGAVEYPQREIINAIIAAGLVSTNSDLDQLTEAIKLLGRIPFAIDGGSANHIVVNPTPAISAYSMPLIMAVQVSFANTGATGVNVSGLGEIPLIRTTGGPMAPNDLPQSGLILIGLVGTSFQLLSVPGSLAFPAAQQLNHYGVDVSASANTITATIDYVGSALPVGIPIMIKVANANTGATVAIINGFSSVPVTRGAGLSLTAGDVASGYIALMVFDGAELQLINFLQGAAGASGGNDITGPDNLYWLAVLSATVSSPPASPTLGDTYLIPVGASGSWTGLAGRISQYNGSGWVTRTIGTRSIVGVADTGLYFQNIGGNVWAEILMLSAGRLFFYAQL